MARSLGYVLWTGSERFSPALAQRQRLPAFMGGLDDSRSSEAGKLQGGELPSQRSAR
jgi:hypothetical protein